MLLDNQLERRNIGITIFWIIIVFYLDPGGFLETNLTPLQNTYVNFLFLSISYAVFFYYYNILKFNKSQHNIIKKYIYIIGLWLAYYFIIYYGILYNGEYPGLLLSVVRNSDVLFMTLIVPLIIYFSIFSLKVFINVLMMSTIIIGFFFIVSVITGIEIIEIWTMDRGVGGMQRSFMYGNGIRQFVVPIVIVGYYLNRSMEVKYKLAFIVSIIIIFISLWRREIIGLLEYLLLASLVLGYVKKSNFLTSLKKYFNVKNLLFITVLLSSIVIFKPKVVDQANGLLIRTLVGIGIMESGYETPEDKRLSLTAKIGIVNAIKENPYFGTGYNKSWYTGDGGDNEWEGSDYVLLATVAMYGGVGIVIFLPFYFFYMKYSLQFIKYLRLHYKIIERYLEFFFIPVIVGLASSIEIFKNIIEYPNWFFPIAAIPENEKYFIFLGLLLGSYFNVRRKMFYLK